MTIMPSCGERPAVAQDDLFDVADAEAVHHDVVCGHVLLGDVEVILGELGHLAVVHQDARSLSGCRPRARSAVRGAHEVIAVHRHEELRLEELHDELDVVLRRVAGRVDVHEAEW